MSIFKSNSFNFIASIAVVSTISLLAISHINGTPTWYELKDNGIYSCTGTEVHKDLGMYTHTDTPSVVYESSYGKNMYGGEYYKFNDVDGNECAVLRKANVYDPETYCTNVGVIDTLSILPTL